MSGKNDEIESRIGNYEKVRREMLEQGYGEHIHTISILKANVMALVTAGPVALVCCILYFMLRSGASFTFGLPIVIAFLAVFILSIPIHELLHGITWRCFCQNGWKSIRLDVDWKTLTPYCHCEESLSLGGYLLGGLMPLFVLGFGMFALAAVLGNHFLLTLSLLSILGAGGDLTIAGKLMRYFPVRHTVRLYDHPTDCGFIAFTK